MKTLSITSLLQTMPVQCPCSFLVVNLNNTAELCWDSLSWRPSFFSLVNLALDCFGWIKRWKILKVNFALNFLGVEFGFWDPFTQESLCFKTTNGIGISTLSLSLSHYKSRCSICLQFLNSKVCFACLFACLLCISS